MPKRKQTTYPYRIQYKYPDKEWQSLEGEWMGEEVMKRQIELLKKALIKITHNEKTIFDNTGENQ